MPRKGPQVSKPKAGYLATEKPTKQDDTTKRLVIEAFEMGATSLAGAAAWAGIDRKTLYSIRAADPTFHAKIRETRRKAVTSLEMAVYQGAIKHNDPNKAIEALKRYNGNFWNVKDKQDISHNHVNPQKLEIKVIWE